MSSAQKGQLALGAGSIMLACIALSLNARIANHGCSGASHGIRDMPGIGHCQVGYDAHAAVTSTVVLNAAVYCVAKCMDVESNQLSKMRHWLAERGGEIGGILSESQKDRMTWQAGLCVVGLLAAVCVCACLQSTNTQAARGQYYAAMAFYDGAEARQQDIEWQALHTPISDASSVTDSEYDSSNGMSPGA